MLRNELFRGCVLTLHASGLVPREILRFHRRVDLREWEPGACWEWTGARDADGYGQLHMHVGDRKRTLKAHRVAFVIKHGQLESRDCVLHSCHNPACCNPDHLRIGTHARNMRDRREAGRYGRPHQSRLTKAEVVRMRERYAEVRNIKDVAAEFGRTRSCVGRVVHGRVWRDAGGPIVPAGLFGPRRPKSA